MGSSFRRPAVPDASPPGTAAPLRDQPTVATRRRKCLMDLTPAFEHQLPIWELRVGVFRVFYDVEEDEQRVHVRAVRRKEPPQKTEDIV